MSKVRVYEVAKQLNLEPKAVVAMFQTMGIPEVRNHMSSVDADAVERIKRQIERQKTHDVVEERIRPTVVKRRAIAKPTDAAPSAPQIAAPPTSAKSVASVADRASNRSVPVIEDSRESARALSDDSAATAKPVAPTRVIVPATPRETLERTSVRELPEVPEDRGSTREVVAAAPSRPQVSEQVEAKIPMPVPSAPSLRDDEPLPEVVPVAPPSVAAAPVVEAAPPPAPEPPPAPVVAAPVEAPPVPSAPPPRAPQRTGIEVWGGRPGVPMPTPVNVTRTGIGGGSTGGMARRVQYDPRAGSGPGSQRPGARPMGPGGRPGGPMNRGAAGMRGGRPGFNVPKRTVANTAQEMSAHKKVIRIEENITLASMAQRMSLKATELLMKLLSMGMTNVHINTSLDADTAKILAGEFGWEVEDVAVSEEDNIAAARGDDTAPVDEDLVPRAPVVTVMGHVDHGKTSLLDKIRKANVAAGEAGGITQHIGAYKVQTQNGTIVFLDTPGHEAFTQMRARGASVTDIVILVVAADDGVMPQTKEAVNHAKAAKVPIIVAVNKCDKPGAEPDRARRELVELGLQPEEWGGDTIFVNVSAHTGENISTLLEMVALQAEVLDLKANPKKAASCTVIEALLDRGRGPVARVLVQDGTLHVGDFVLAGAGFGKVRAMVNEHGKQVHEAGPATPVEILGLSDVPSAGETLHAVKDAKKAQEIAESRKTKAAAKGKGDIKISLEELSKRIADAGQQELRVIVKGDVQGSVEAVSDSLKKLSGEKVRLSVIHSGVGAITEGDVHLAIAGKAIVIGFNVRPAGKAGALADENRIEIRIYSIIYQAIDDVKSAMEGLLPAHLVEKVTGKAELRQLFKIKGIAIAGSYVLEGVVKRNAFIRVVREGVVVHEGKLGALKRFKDDVKDVAEGFECGISLENFNDIKEGDILECYEMEEVKQKL